MDFTDRGGVFKRNVDSATKDSKPMSPISKETSPTGPSCWVKKWVDYSSKYGLGYLLSN